MNLRMKNILTLILVRLCGVRIGFLKKVTNPKGTITTDISKKSGVYFWNNGIGYGSVDWTNPDNFDLYGAGFISICNVGAITRLGDIITIPATGFTVPSQSDKSIACKAGYGYVIKMTNRNNLTAYARLYVVKRIVDKNRKTAGAIVRYQFPFVPIRTQ